MQCPSRQLDREAKRKGRPRQAAGVLMVSNAVRDPDGRKPSATTQEHQGKREADRDRAQGTTWRRVASWHKWAGQVSVRISSRKKGALYHLSYRPIARFFADSPASQHRTLTVRTPFTLA
jgi:hypothetical protein